MSTLFHSNRSAGEHRLRERIFNVLPAATFQMDRMLQLMDIIESDRSPTACVECVHQPRLHINPNFVAEHCPHDEDLFLLVMHELNHVVLGHTRLFPRITPLHNLVFDAVINAMLCRQFPEPRYTRFFQRLNPWDQFPARLLAPPPGWPDQPASLPDDASQAEHRAFEVLYGDDSDTGTYLDVYEALKTCLDTDEAASAPGDPGKHPDLGDAVLLGNHGNEYGPGDEATVSSPALRDVVRKIVEKWPPPPKPIAGRDEGSNPADFRLEPKQSRRKEFQRALKRLLHRAGVLNPGQSENPRVWRTVTTERQTSTVLPQWRDRQATAWKQITGRRPLFYQELIREPRRRLEPGEVAHVYLDISGSMTLVLPLLSGALNQPHREGRVKLYVFSTVVDDVSPRIPLHQQNYRNTGGTNIDCVLTHLEGLSRRMTPRRVLLLTDGYTGPPDLSLIRELKSRGVRFLVGLVGGDATSDELAPYVDRMETLPEL